jgi:hypothetical protein
VLLASLIISIQTPFQFTLLKRPHRASSPYSSWRPPQQLCGIAVRRADRVERPRIGRLFCLYSSKGFILGYDVSELAEDTVFSKKMRLPKVFLPRLKSE